MSHRTSLIICFWIMLSAPLSSHATSGVDHSIESVVKDLCHKNVVLLGEASHGDGKTITFKVALAKRLIQNCHFNVVLFESGLYDFLNLHMKLDAGDFIAAEQLGLAIKPFWTSTREFEPLVSFLVKRVNSRAVKIGGMDDQIDRTSVYARNQMPAELVKFLPEKAQSQCRSKLLAFVNYQYVPEEKPQILVCLDQIGAEIDKSENSKEWLSNAYGAMAKSLKRLALREFGSDSPIQSMNNRDFSMYQNFQWLRSADFSHKKVIVWGASVHMAKDESPLQQQEKRTPFGYYIHRDFEEQAFALGFSAYSGSYAMIGQPVRQLTIAPDSSLEGFAFQKSQVEMRYLGLRDLSRMGNIQARPFNYEWNTKQWVKTFDGMVIFREEGPPHFIDK